MTIVTRERVLAAYILALTCGADHVRACEIAADALCLPYEAVAEAVEDAVGELAG